MAPEMERTVLIMLSLPSAPVCAGPGQATVVPISEEPQAAGSCAFRYEVNRNELPELSDRCTGTMAAGGRVAPGFRFLIAGSSHRVIVPAKIRARIWPFSRRWVAGPTPG